MNLAITPSSALPEKEFVSSATFGMLAIVTVLVFATAVAGSSVSTLMILALPVTLFVLSLTNEQARLETRQNARRNAAATATRTSEVEDGVQAETYFPSWLGSKAYATACAAEQD
jgi:c-di-AMP phosphodiesterase-like protein